MHEFAPTISADGFRGWVLAGPAHTLIVGPMCEVPRRSWRRALHPWRIVLGVLALACVVVGALLPRAVGLVVVGLGVALLVTAVLGPVIRQVEFGFPSGVKVSTAMRDREDELRRVFEGQSGELEMCAQLLLDDQTTAKRLLEAAWSRTTSTWRGPATPEIRIYVLCTLVQLAIAELRWTRAQSSPAQAQTTTPLATLTFSERVVVVLRDFARLGNSQIAQITERPLEDVERDWRHAELAVAESGHVGGTP